LCSYSLTKEPYSKVLPGNALLNCKRQVRVNICIPLQWNLVILKSKCMQDIWVL